MSSIDPGVYKQIFKVKVAYPFDIGCFLMRFFFYMTNIGVVTMLTLSGYSFLVAGLVSSVIALSIFLISPRISKLVDEKGQSRIVPFGAVFTTIGLAIILCNVWFEGPEWVCFLGAPFLGVVPNAQAMARTRWIYLIRSGKLGKDAPSMKTIFSYEGVIDDVTFMLSPPSSIALASAITPIAGLLIGGICYIVGCIILTSAKQSEPVPGWSPSDSDQTSKKTNMAKRARKKSMFRSSSVVRILFTLLLLTGMFYGIFDTAAIAFAEESGDANIASVALMASGLISMVVGFLFGMIRLNIQPYKQLILFTVLLGLAYGTLFFVNSVTVFFVISCVAAVTYAPFLIVSNTACERAVPTDRLTEAIAWMNSGMTCGMAVGPTLGGFLIDFLGSGAGFDMAAVIALLVPATSLACYKIIKRNVKSDTYEIIA